MSDIRVDIKQTLKRYDVDTARARDTTAPALFHAAAAPKKTLGTFFDALFDADNRNRGEGLCAVAHAELGYPMPRCEDAAAFTSWTLTWQCATKSGGVFDMDTRRKCAAQCALLGTILLMVPRWAVRDTEVLDAANSAAVASFIRRTAEHERGHALACVVAADCIVRFVRELPEQLPAHFQAADVAAMNHAVDSMVAFYIDSAHRSDRAYDVTTDHGLLQGGELASSVDVLVQDAQTDVSAKPLHPRAPLIVRPM